MNVSGIYSNTGVKMIGANGTVSNTAITGNIISSQITSVANTQITGNITAAQITSVANTQLTGTITGSQISSNTLSNTVFQTGSVENYMNAQGLSFGMRNRIINGAMVIDQRNAGAAVTAINVYTLDRYKLQGTQSSKINAQQNAGAVTPPAGFTYYLGATSQSAFSVAATDYFRIFQPIEGFNTADFAWGTASASSVTLSFWVRSSLTGTHGGSFSNNDNNRYYVYSYTISSANTWEYKTITVAGDTSGTWKTDNNIGIQLGFNYGTGTTYSGTAGSWGSTQLLAPTGAVSVVGTSGATFYITGVQLEKGSTATSFDYRPYGTELLLCQRYCENIIASGTNPPLWSLQAGSSTNARGGYFYKVQKRASPSFTNLIGTSYLSQYGSGNFTPSAVSLASSNPNGALVDSTCTGLTLGQAGFQLEGTLTAGTIICLFTSEL
jgi:hypothetical protein